MDNNFTETLDMNEQDQGRKGMTIGELLSTEVYEKDISNIDDANVETRDCGSSDDDSNQKTKSGGGCSKSSSSCSGKQSCSGQTPDKECKTPKLRLKVDENDIPEYWWDKLPDFDPRVYDAIMAEQAAACVDYIFQGLPDIREIEHQIESKKFRKVCPRLKTQVPRTKVIKPREMKCDTKIDDFIKSETY